eukprot:4926817-Alexandrium_andersonii.AAC.1
MHTPPAVCTVQLRFVSETACRDAETAVGDAGRRGCVHALQELFCVLRVARHGARTAEHAGRAMCVQSTGRWRG